MYFRLLLSFCACKKSSSQAFTCLAAQQNCMSAGCTVLAHLRFSQKSSLVDNTCILPRRQTSVVAGVRRLKPFTCSQFLWHDSVSDPHLQPTRPGITRHVLLQNLAAFAQVGAPLRLPSVHRPLMSFPSYTRLPCPGPGCI